MAGKRAAPHRSHPRQRWTSIERELRQRGGPLIAGVDEVGRGSLAGPVVACALIMPPNARAIAGVDDSKVLTAAERRRLARLILRDALDVALGAASAAEIDRFNIYHASALAMRRAIARLRLAADHLLVDGRPIRTLRVPHTAIVDGDDKCYSIACASIIAKVTRDRLMAALAARHPRYAWERNCGYATRAHVEALLATGPTRHHRRSFVRVVEAATQFDLGLEHGDELAIVLPVSDDTHVALDGERPAIIVTEASGMQQTTSD